MSGRNSFKNLTKNISPERRAVIDARKIELREEIELCELSQVIGTSQEVLAERLNVMQPVVAKMGRRTDIRINSLLRMIEAMGGSLEIKAHFPQGDVTLMGYNGASSPNK